MARTVAGRRAGPQLDYEAAVSKVMTYGVTETVAYRVVDIAGQFGVNAWPVEGGLITVRLHRHGLGYRYTIEENI